MKKYSLFPLFLLTCAIPLFNECTSREASTDHERLIGELISKMTLEEKAQYVVGTGMSAAFMNADSGVIEDDTVPSYSGRVLPIPRLGLPAILFNDGPAGLNISSSRTWDTTRLYYNTAIPVASLMASTWDTALVYQVGQIVGDEALRYGIDVWLGPSMNIRRNPLNGRNYEYYSEDPFVSGNIAAAMARGAQSKGIAATLKHFAANNIETNRFGLDVIISERALREIYLEGFRIAVEEGRPKAIMSSYNLINHTYTSQSNDLLLKVLREDWDYDGFVMTDWWAGDDPVAQVGAGNDIIMPGSADQSDRILQAVRDGDLDEADLDRDIANILGYVLESPKYKGYKFENDPDLEAHAALVRRAASEGMVLLKNNDRALPVADRGLNIAVLGNTSYDIIAGGSGSGSTRPAYITSLAEGLTSAGYSINQEVKTLYEDYLDRERPEQDADNQMPMFAPPRPVEMTVNAAVMNHAAQESDVAVITLGEVSGEQSDRAIEGGFSLSEVQLNLIKSTTEAFHNKGKKVIVVLNICGIIEMASWRDLPDAILLAWAGGQEAGNAIADILSGSVNPSGKLPVTIPVKYEDVPSAGNFPGEVTGDEKVIYAGFENFHFYPSRVVYEEGIYNGYRYYESFGVAPAWEFGYGMSYTDFSYGEVTLNRDTFKEEITATLTIHNSGDVAGKEIVQLYLTAPANKMDKPALELKGFVKTRLLQPGESQTLEFTLTPRSLASFDTSLSSWIAEAGTYEVRIGASCRDIRQRATFTLTDELVVKKVNKALAPDENIDELKARRNPGE